MKLKKIRKIVRGEDDASLSLWFGAVIDEIAYRTGQSVDEAMYALAAAYWEEEDGSV